MMDIQDNQIECGRCGARFYYELTRCPNCGVSVYPPDEEEQKLPPPAPPGGVFSSLATPLHSALLVLGSWLVAGMLALALYIPFRRALSASLTSFVRQGLIIVATAMGAFCGGFLAGRFARLRRLALGLGVGALSLAWLALLAAREYFRLAQALLSPLMIAGAGVVILAAYGGALLAARMLRQQMAEQLFAGVQSEAALYQDLLSRVFYDQAVAERLIDHERLRNPHANRAALIQAAIEKWERDNRISDGIENV